MQEKPNSKRGIVREYSDRSQRTVLSKLNALFLKKGRFFKVTLTTTTDNPKVATYRLKLWKDAMAYDYSFDGVHSLEFQKNGQCHFHITIRLDGDRDCDRFRRDCYRRWRMQNPSVVNGANEIKPLTNQPDIDFWKSYMAKREQKNLPFALRETGLGCNWCGFFSRSKSNNVDDESSIYLEAA